MVAEHQAGVPGEPVDTLYRAEWEDYWGGEPEGRDAWEAMRNEIRHHRGTRPGPFWWYDEGIPEDLRHNPMPSGKHEPTPPRCMAVGTHYQEMLALEERRAVWLRTVVPEEFDLEVTDADT